MAESDKIIFIKMDKERPHYGQPVLIKIKSIVQHITYTRDGADDTGDWFEPYFFEHDGEIKIRWHEVNEWAPLPNWED